MDVNKSVFFSVVESDSVRRKRRPVVGLLVAVN